MKKCLSCDDGAWLRCALSGKGRFSKVVVTSGAIIVGREGGEGRLMSREGWTNGKGWRRQGESDAFVKQRVGEERKKIIYDQEIE